MKKHMIRMALAGALALGLAGVAKADGSAPTFSLLAQELATQNFGTYSGTGINNTPNNTLVGDKLNFTLQHVQLGGSYGIDAIDTVTVKSELVGGFALLDAYDVHALSDIYNGLALKVGQFKIPFGADIYATPDQLIRVGYSTIDGLAPTGIAAAAVGGGNWDLGLELDQNWSDLTLQVAVLQNGNANSVNTGNKDYVGRAQWKSSNVVLGLSDYYQSTYVGFANNNNNLNTLGANASVIVDVFQLDLEAIFGNAGNNGYTGTLSAKFNGFQPAVWYEFQNPATVPANTTSLQNPDLGAGLNFWLAAKTELKIDVDFTGYNAVSNGNGDLLAKNAETVQLQEVF